MSNLNLPTGASAARGDRLTPASAGRMLCGLVLFGLLWAAPAAAQPANQPPPDGPMNKPTDAPVRELFVPVEQWDVLLEANPRHVFLTRDEYAELLRQAQQSPETLPPEALLVLSADYDGTIADGRLQIAATLTYEVLRTGLHAAPLPLAQVGVRQALLDGQPARLGRDDGGAVRLFLEGVGRHELTLDLVSPVATAAAQQSLALTIPTPPATRLRLAVPGNVEVRSGATVVSRQLVGDGQATRFDLQPPRGPLAITMSLNNRFRREQQVLLARGLLVSEVTQAYERLHVTLAYQVLQGAVERLRIAAPDGWEVTEVRSPLVANWVLREVDSRRVIEVTLTDAVTDAVQLNITAQRQAAPLGDEGQAWTMPALEPLDVANYLAVLGLLVEDRLQAEQLTPAQLIPLDTTRLQQFLPESIFHSEPGSPRLRPVAAYYAPRGNYALTAQVTRPKAALRAEGRYVLTLNDTRQTLDATLHVAPAHDPLFEFAVRLPSGWQAASLNLVDGEALPIDVRDEADGARRLLVRLPRGFAPGQAAAVQLVATRVAPDWLGDWREIAIAFPLPSVADAQDQSGVIQVRAEDDLTVRPVETTGLVPLDATETNVVVGGQSVLAYRFEQATVRGEFLAVRTPPRATAHVLNFLRVDPEGLAAHYELIFDVQQGHLRQVAFHLPEQTPESLAIRGLDEAVVKEFSSRVADGQRHWTVELAAKHAGRVRVAVDFQQPLPAAAPSNWELPLATAAGVAYQSAAVAVEGHPDFDATLQTNGRRIDVGELAEGDYQVGRRLLGAFGFAAAMPQVTIDLARRDGYGIPTAIIQRAELASLLAAHGRCQTAARYLLRTKATYLAVDLPVESRLWSVTVGGQPVAPQSDGQRLLVGLPAAGADVVDLQIVYETPLPVAGWLRDVQITAPRLFVRGAADQVDLAVPAADAQWDLLLPSGYRLVRQRGSLDLIVAPDRPEPLQNILGAAWLLSGGVGGGPFFLQGAREAARHRSASEMSDLAATAPESERLGYTMPAPALSVEGQMGGAARVDLTAGADAAVAVAESAPATDRLGRPVRPQPEAPLVEQLAAAPSEQQLRDAAGRLAEGRQFWALQGVRSLQIELDRSTDAVRFQSLGGDPRLVVTMAPATQWRFLGWAWAGLVVVIGVAKVGASARRKARFIVAMALLGLIAPLIVGAVTDWTIDEVCEPPVYAACLLIPFYLLVGSTAGLVRWLASLPWTRPTRPTAAAVLLLAVSVFGGATAASAQEPADAAALPNLRELLRPPPPVVLPTNAVIIPYDPADPLSVAAANKVLVPYAEYERLWRLAHPDQPLDNAAPPASYAFAGARYQATLGNDDHVTIDGTLELELLSDEAVAIPLRLVGGVLTRATIDGGPARLHTIQPVGQPVGQPAGAEPAKAEPAESPLLVLQLTGRGRKQLQLTVLARLERTGGWRAVQGQLPVAPATSLTLTVPSAGTEVRLTGIQDRESIETTTPDQRIETALGSEPFRWQWRPGMAVAQVDRSLTVESQATLDVREDGLRLLWRAHLRLGRSQRDQFTLHAPAGYLIEGVRGDNVRGWSAAADGDRQRIDVSLLQAATGDESFDVQLARMGAIGADGLEQFEAPYLVFPDAARQSGRYTIRRSSLLTVQAAAGTGMVQQVETAGDGDQVVVPPLLDDDSPLGVVVHQAFTFSAAPFPLAITAARYEPRVSSETWLLVRLAERAVQWEARLRLTVADRPLHELELVVPGDVQINQLTAPSLTQWTSRPDGARQRLRVQFAQGLSGEIAVDLSGELPGVGANGLPAPSITVVGAQRQEGYLVLQSDPGDEVIVENASLLERTPLESLTATLTPEQHGLARVAYHFLQPDYAALVRLRPRTPLVVCTTVSNVRVTPREIQETVLLRFRVTEAGLRELSFVVPARLREAQITVPLLREKTIEPMTDNDSLIRVRLVFQDEMMGELIVLVEHDRALAAERHTAPIPVVETGRTEQRFVVLESAGRDEIVVTRIAQMEELNSRAAAWRRLTELLGDKITQAFAVADQAAAPVLEFESRGRELVRTSGAAIRLAETRLALDQAGAYRAEQTYRLDNRDEPFLEIELPAGASLWTVTVAGEVAKPAVAPSAGNDRRVRVPLIKTTVGDLDYAVVLKYGGALPSLQRYGAVQFPFIKTINVQAEESQVRLYLPDSHQWWNFGGTVPRAGSQAELDAQRLGYESKRIQDLLNVVRGEGDIFGKTRALYNLKQFATLSSAVEATYSRGGDGMRGEQDQRVAAEREALVRQALEQANAANHGLGEVDKGIVIDNRSRLNQLSLGQQVKRGSEQVLQLGNNFAVPPQSTPLAKTETAGGSFYGFRRAEPQSRSRVAGNAVDSAPIAADPFITGKPAARGKSSAAGLLAPHDEKKTDDESISQQAGRKDAAQEQIERYSRQLERQQAPASPQPANAPLPEMPGMAGQSPARMQAVDNRDAYGAANQAALPELAVNESRREQDGALATHDWAQAPATGLTSLDLPLPMRGREFLFATPRGDLQITAHAVRQADIDRAIRLVLVALFVAAIWAAGRLIRFVSATFSKPVVGLICLFTGLTSTCAGALPVVGIVLLVGGFVLLIRSQLK